MKNIIALVLLALLFFSFKDYEMVQIESNPVTSFGVDDSIKKRGRKLPVPDPNLPKNYIEVKLINAQKEPFPNFCQITNSHNRYTCCSNRDGLALVNVDTATKKVLIYVTKIGAACAQAGEQIVIVCTYAANGNPIPRRRIYECK